MQERRCCGCGATLINRTGKYGDFAACPNWPTCKAKNHYPEQGIVIDAHWSNDYDEDFLG